VLELLESRSVPSVNVNTDTTLDGPLESAPHNETSIAVNPTNPMNMVGGANDYQVVRNGNSLHLTLLSRGHVTFDGGQTWTMYPIPFRGYNFAQDPSVSFDTDGTVYFSSLGFVNSQNGTDNGNNPDIIVSHSTDGGQTWSTPVRIAKGKGSYNSTGIGNDKPYITAWGHGNAIVTWTQYNYGPQSTYISAPIYASVTHDGGTTWSDPVKISGPYVNAIDAVPIVAADGMIYAAFWSWDNEAAPDYRDHYVVAKVNPATAQPLGLPVEVALVYDGIYDYAVPLAGSASPGERERSYEDSQFRTWAQGNIAADPTDAQHLSVIWSDMRNNPYPDARLPSWDPYAVLTNSDIIVSRSFDGGQTWSSPTAIEASGDQFMPWGAYTSSGQLQIGYYDRSYDTANHKYGYTLASETRAGSLKFTFQQVSTALSDPTTDCGFPGISATVDLNFPNANTFIGDYCGIAVVPGTNQVAAFWTDLREQSVNGGWAEDAFFALVDPPAAASSASSGASALANLVSTPLSDVSSVLVSTTVARPGNPGANSGSSASVGPLAPAAGGDTELLVLNDRQAKGLADAMFALSHAAANSTNAATDLGLTLAEIDAMFAGL
jgi:hypothetical protein